MRIHFVVVEFVNNMYPDRHVVHEVGDCVQLRQLVTEHDVHLFIVLSFTYPTGQSLKQADPNK